jgi:hypothetical protein
MTSYTFEIYKTDRRTTVGERLVLVKQYEVEEEIVRGLTNKVNEVFPASKGFRVVAIQTYVTRKNAMTGVEFQERYDTPYYCSPSSESFFSN